MVVMAGDKRKVARNTSVVHLYIANSKSREPQQSSAFNQIGHLCIILPYNSLQRIFVGQKLVHLRELCTYPMRT
ncbi:hypothetical protein T4B_4956 [Trichinella pseudospiralis]|uniref:Uncharacterized protein n=1 Tax=Trichinella pseudospiralis TaxID=6337 RepID=A0A0V1IZF4_TRIPS|nr:hypothetical protein T4B_4956 [Trichinella pseudospiralis]KRZ42367.1 hypothetical protein T4C_5030 [Trichinella pseudospiralis]